MMRGKRLASLKPGDEVIVWSDDWRSQIWYRARVVEWADQSSIRLHDDGAWGLLGKLPWSRARVGLVHALVVWSPLSFHHGWTALRGVEVDQLRATIDATRWSDVPDSAVGASLRFCRRRSHEDHGTVRAISTPFCKP